MSHKLAPTPRVLAAATLLAALLSAPLVADAAGIDANSFRVGHPASPRWVLPHANAEHPAVQLRLAAPRGIDANTFLVQPPAHTDWLAAPAAVAARQLAALR